MGSARAAAIVAAAALLLAGCGDDGGRDLGLDRVPDDRAAPPAPVPDAPDGPDGPDGPDATVDAPDEPDPSPTRRVELRLDRRVTDDATADFAATVAATLSDPRGWRRAGFEIAVVDDAPYLVVLAEGDVVDELCHPYTTGGRFSCQNGPIVALNADRWRDATPQWTGDLHEYRQMLVNHEVGHLLGEHHPLEQCPAPGQPAPVMAQQSTNLAGCLPNPWPLDWEVECARDHPGPLAPPFERGPALRCGPDGAVEQDG